MANLLQIEHRSRISDFCGRLVPSLITALYYSRIAGVPLEPIVDDDVDLKTFRNQLVRGYKKRGDVTRKEIIHRVSELWRE